MNPGNNMVMGTARKLLLETFVEVRQKEIGLRGSWHPGRVVRVKYGRRVVEYDDLLTLDQSRKLRESIHLSNDRKMHSTTLRAKDQLKSEPERRGFIRPRPPPCSVPPVESWRQGLLVDAFYDGAWWEGILLDDVHSYCTGSKYNVFFPEEGDELAFLTNDLRVSQEWDEVSGEWAVQGYWPLQNEMGTIDLSSLKDICRKGRSFLKNLWRQKRFNDLQVSQVEEQQGLPSSCSLILENTPESFAKGEEKPSQDAPNFSRANIMIQNEATQNSFQNRFIQSPSFSKSTDTCSSLCSGVKAGFQCRNGGVVERPTSEADRRTMFSDFELSQEQGDEVHCSQRLSSMDEVKQDFHTRQHVSNAKVKEINNQSDALSKLTGADPNITRSIFGNLESDKVSLLRSREIACRSSNRVVLDNALMQEDKLPFISCKEMPFFQNLQLSKSTFLNELSSNTKQAYGKSTCHLPFTEESCQKVNENQSNCADGQFGGNGVVRAAYFAPQKVRVRQVRIAAKQFLLDAGWRLDVRNRIRGQLTKQEVIYVSPSGSRYFSLAAACRGWKLHETNDQFPVPGTQKEFELASVYCMAEQRRRSQKAATGQDKAEQRTLLQSSCFDGNFQSSYAECDLLGGAKHATEAVDMGKADPSSTASLHMSNCPRLDVRIKKKTMRLNGESQKRRKIDVNNSISPSEVRRRKGALALKNRGCRMQVLLTCPGNEKNLDLSKTAGDPIQFKKSTVLSWLMDKGILKENEPVSYINRKDGHVMKKGRVTREGVICDCCLEVFTLSNFEAHAGSKLHRPSANTFLDDGRSISDCQLEACAFQDVKEKDSLMGISDDTCGVCGDGGELVLCDHCPSTFHAACIGLEVIPKGDWYCPRCCCGICGSHQRSAHDIDDVVHRCGQCELQYHLICAQGHTTLETVQTSVWFCDKKCKQIFTALRCSIGISNPLEDGFSWTLLRSMKKDRGVSPWSLEEMAEHHSKLSVAHGVLQECFAPMIDPRTNINLLSQAIYNRWSRVSRLNYSGFYTIVLERGDEIISVATIRVHGARLAEVPLVGTRYQYRRQGMCRRLMRALEEMLRGVGVEKLLLPAVSELLDTWMGAFSFMKLSPQETRELSKLSMMTFPGTTLLQKSLPAGSEANGSICLPYALRQSDNTESPPCKSIEAFFSMTHAPLDRSVPGCQNTFLTEANSRQGSVSDLNFAKHIYHSGSAFLLADPQTPVAFEPSKVKCRLKSDYICSAGDSFTHKLQKDDDIYTSVVIATTRSNRLVKSRRWVADGLKELKNAKLSKRPLPIPDTFSEPAVDCNKLFETLVRSDFVEERQNVETVYVRTRRKTSLSVGGVRVNEGESDEGRDVLGTAFVDMHQEDPGNFRSANKKNGNLKCQQGAITVLSNGEIFSCANDGMEDLHVDQQRVGMRMESATTVLSNGKNFSCVNDGMGDLHVDQQRVGKRTEDELVVCANFYSRRKKKERACTGSTRDFDWSAAALHDIEQQTGCGSSKGAEGPGTSLLVLESPSGLLEGTQIILN